MKRLNQAFKSTKLIEPSAKLEAAILCNIKNAQVRRMRQKLIFSEAGLVGSTLAVFYTLFSFGQALLRSEFWSMMSLAFTDAGIVFSHWNDFLYSAMETFPALSLAIILMPFFVMFLSGAWLRSIKKHITVKNGNMLAFS